MDFHIMKRKELQALCKKHGIPANLTNLEMANQLASLKEKEKPVARGKSCLRSTVEQPSETLSDGVNKQSKKVKFSPENETIEFLKSETKPEKLGRGVRRRSMSVVEIEDIVSAKNVGNGKFTRDNLNSPIRLTRSRAEKVTSEVENLAIPDAPKTETVKRGSRSVAGRHVSTVEDTATRRCMANKEVENKKEVIDDALLRKNPTKRTSRRGVSTNEVPDFEVASRKETEEVNVDVVLKKNQSQRISRSRVVKSGPEIMEGKGHVEVNGIVETQKVVTRSKRNTKQIEDHAELNQSLCEVKLIQGGRARRHRGHVNEDAKVIDVALESATEVLLQVEESSRRSSRYGGKRQSILTHTEKMGGDYECENNTLVKSTTLEENARSKRSSLSYNSTEVSETILAKNDIKKKPKIGKRDPVLEEENVVIEESTLVEEAPRRSSRNSNRRQSFMPQTEKVGADQSKGKYENNTMLKSSDFEENSKLHRISSRRKSFMVSNGILAENVGKKKPRSRRLDPVLEEGNAEIKGSCLVEEPPKKSMRNGAKAQKNSATIKTGKAVPRKKLQDTIKEPNAQSKLLEEIIPVVEQVINAQPTMPDIAESSKSPVTNSIEILSDNVDEESQGEIPISVIEIDTVAVDKSNLSQDCTTNEDNFDSNNLALLESKMEVKLAMDVVPSEALFVEEDYSKIDKQDAKAKAADDLDSQNELGMGENNDMEIEAFDDMKQDHEESRGEIPISVIGIDTVEVDKSNLSQDCTTNEDNFDSNNLALLESMVEVNIAMGVAPPEASLGEEDFSQIDQRNEAKAVEGMNLQKELGMGENNDMKIQASHYVEKDHEDTQAKLDKTLDLEELKVDEDNDPGKYTCSSSAISHDGVDAENSYNSEDKHFVDPEVVCDISYGENNISSAVEATGRCAIERSVVSSTVSEFPIGKEQPYLRIEGNGDTEHNVEGYSAQYKGINSKKNHLEIANEEPTDSSILRTSARKEVTPVKMELKVSDEVENLAYIEPEDGEELKPDFENENYLAQDNGRVLNKRFDFVNEDDEASTFPDTSYQNRTTASQVEQDEVEISPLGSKSMECTNSSSWVSVVKRETLVEKVDTSNSSEAKAPGLMATADPTMLDLDVTESFRSPTGTGRDNGSNLEEKQHSRAATPIFVSEEIRSLMQINLEKTPTSELGIAHNLKLQEDNATSASVTVKQIEVLNKVINENTSRFDRHSHLPLGNPVDKPRSPFTSYGDFEVENPVSSMCTENLIASQEAQNSGERIKIHSFGDGCSSDSEESRGTENEFDTDYNTMTAEYEVQSFQATSIQTAREHAECLDIAESVRSPRVTSRDISLEQKNSVRAATRLSVSNEIKSLMLVNLDRTSVSELGKVHNLMLQEVHATSAIGTIDPVEDLTKVTNESSNEVLHHSPSAQEDHVVADKPNNPSSGEMKRPESGMCSVNPKVSQETHDSGEKNKSQTFGDEYSIETQESDGKETDYDVDNNTVSAESETQPFEATSPQTARGSAEYQGNGGINIEVSPTELRLLFDDKHHEDVMTLDSNCIIIPLSLGSVSLTQSKDDDETNGVGNNLETGEKNRDAVTQEQILSPIENKDGDTQAIGSYDDSFAGTPCVESRNSASNLLYRASASKSIDLITLLKKENKGIDEMVPGHAHENAPRETNAPEASDILPDENAERTLTSSILEADFVDKDQDDVFMDNLNSRNPEELRSVTFDSDKHKVAWELSEGTSTTLDKLTAKIEDEDLVKVSIEVERDLTQVDEGMFDDLNGHEMEMVQEMFEEQGVNSPSDCEADSSSDSDHYSVHEKPLTEENASNSTDNSLEKEESVDGMANFVSKEISALEDFLESSQKHNKRTEVADESQCYKSSSKGMVQCLVESNECADKQNMSQASQSCLPDTGLGNSQELSNSQDSLGSNMFSSWELNLFSESEATIPTPVVSKVPNAEADKVFVYEKQLGRDNHSVEGFVDTFVNPVDPFCGGDETLKGTDEAKEVDNDFLEIEPSHFPSDDATVTEAFYIDETEDNGLLGVNIPHVGAETMGDEAAEACEASIKSDLITEDTPLGSVNRAVLGGSGTEDLVIVTNPLDTQEQMNSSRKASHDVGTGLEEEYFGNKFNICEDELGTVVGEGDAVKVDMFDDQGLTFSSLFPIEEHKTEIPFSMEDEYAEPSEPVVNMITREENNLPEHSEELKVETVDGFVEEQSFQHTKVQNLSQNFTPNTTGNDAIVASSLFDKNQPFDFANSAVKEDSEAEDIEQSMDSINVENTFEKADKGEMYVFETNSTISKTQKRRSLIQRTPKKLAGSFDLKENATSIKRENLGSVTAKSTAKRRALVERPKWI